MENIFFGENSLYYDILTIFMRVVFFIFLVLAYLILTLTIAYFTLFERKTLASMQRRSGPNVTGFSGLLQPIADAAKLIMKETLRPNLSDRGAFFIAPIFTFGVALLAWLVLPVDTAGVIASINVGMLYLIATSSISVYGIIIAGWASNSRYALLGALRSAAQMLSYELSMGFILLSIFLVTGSLNPSSLALSQLTNTWYVHLMWPAMLLFIVCALAETSRPPFDLPEAESELVSGYHVEYSSATFALFFLAEYCHILTMSAIMSIVFFGGSIPFYPAVAPHPFWFAVKLIWFVYFFIWIRASVPRYRYDQLIRLGWKYVLPLSILFFVFISVLFFVFDFFPPSGGCTFSTSFFR